MVAGGSRHLRPWIRSALLASCVGGCGDSSRSGSFDAHTGEIDASCNVDAAGGVDADVAIDSGATADGAVELDAGDGECTGSSTIVINEVRYDLPGSGDAGNEWVELYNPTGSAIDLSGWTLEWGASSFSSSITLAADTEISADSYFVIGGADVDTADLPTAALVNLGNASTAPDGVRLVNGGSTVVDTVLYGEAGDNTDGWIDDCGLATMWAPDTFSSESLARMPNGVDTNSGSDFQGDNSPTMGAANN